MAQVDKKLPMKKIAAGAGALVAAALCLKLLLTPDAVTHLDAAALRSVTAEDAFKTAQGDGSRSIHVFLSTECTFCHQIEPELDKLDNVTVHRHLLPGTTPASREKAMAVWCAADPVAAWKNVVAGKANTPAQCDSSALDRNLELGKRLGLTSTPSIIYENGNVSAGMLLAGDIAARMAGTAPR
jgi:thiol:disulfide interchange protein DsbC